MNYTEMLFALEVAKIANVRMEHDAREKAKEKKELDYNTYVKEIISDIAHTASIIKSLQN